MQCSPFVYHLEYVLSCSKLWGNLKDHNITTHILQFDDIYSQDINKQKAVTSLYRSLLEEQDKIMNSQPAAIAGNSLGWQLQLLLFVWYSNCRVILLV